ncbi:type VI secretion system protein TssA [Caballeronia sp.]|uniref:type VI secretion system protein TssA n=1 Tax=Caballeronia sp. TaxID=1931223 RepID=UPI003C604381
MKSPFSLSTEIDLSVDASALLTPLHGSDGDGDGAGVSLRSDPLYRQIQDARRQDDASLPMGEWERPLVKADWKTVAALCDEALRTRSKDFQFAAWLCEAWTHLHGIDGLVAGTRLLTGLVERYWEVAYPKLEDGDTDARAAPFVWINPTLALVLSLKVPLLVIEEREPSMLCLDEFQRAIGTPEAQEDNLLSRELLDQHVAQAGNLVALARLRDRLVDARDAWDKFARLVDLRLEANAPSFAPVADVLARLSRAATGLIGEHEVPALPVSHARDETSGQSLDAGLAERTATAEASASARAVTSLDGMIIDRSHAYRLLDDIAGYLTRHEPHSPTPYLLKRAVSWERMPLAELMREITRHDGDLTRYLALLGLE